MITFGGRVLNTYPMKGGAMEGTYNPLQSGMNEKYNLQNEPIVKEISQDLIKIIPPNSEQTNLGQSNYGQTNLGQTNSGQSNSGQIIGGDQKSLAKQYKELKYAAFKDTIVVKIFGKEVVYGFRIILMICTWIYTFLILFIIFSICYFLHEITQGILDASHKLLDGVSSALTKMNDAAINFTVPGINKKIGPFNFSTPDLFTFNQRLFGGAFTPWIRDVNRSNDKFPRSATELIIEVLLRMMVGIIEKLPSMLEGMINVMTQIIK